MIKKRKQGYDPFRSTLGRNNKMHAGVPETGLDAFKRAMASGAKFVFIAQGPDGMLHVSGNCDKDWLVKALDAARAGLPGVADTPETQCKLIEMN